TGDYGQRMFTAEPIVSVSATMLTVDGQGRSGLCFGDSGGPVMSLVADGSVRVLGSLSGGEGSCVGRDHFTRTDAYRLWVEEVTGPVPDRDGVECRNLDQVGRCISDTTAVWCGIDGTVQSDTCEEDQACGWDEAFGVFGCVDRGADPCEGVSEWGACDGDVATYCDRGELRRVDCGDCGRICGFAADQGGVTCQQDPCNEIGAEGRCMGGMLQRCDGGELVVEECSNQGLDCMLDATTDQY